MALQYPNKLKAKQVILSAIQAVSASTGKDLSLRVITYSAKDQNIVANLRIADGASSVDVSHVFAGQQVPNKSAIVSAITSAISRNATQPVMAADEDLEMDDSEGDMTPIEDTDFMGGGDVTDAVDDLADAVNDIQDDLEDIQEDDVSIQTENNIDNHLIAECDACSGVFISAMVKSDQKVTSVSGICPLCGKESTQNFKWYITNLEYDDTIPNT